MIDVKAVAERLQKLYRKEYKDDRAERIICTGDVIKRDYTDADVIPLAADHPIRKATNLPGIPFNKIVQIAGNPDTGKSTIAALSMIAAQESGAQVILWDAEEKFDAFRFEALGGKAESLLLARTNEILKGGELIRNYINTCKEQDPDCKILVVWDSVGASQSRSHAERQLDSEKHQQPGQDAKENGSVCKMLSALFSQYPDSLCVLLINQVYDKIGFGQKGQAATGGKKIEFHSSLIIHMKREKIISKKVDKLFVKTGIISKLTVAKNHLSQDPNSIYQMNFFISFDAMTVCDSAFKKKEDEVEEVETDESETDES